MAIIVGTDLGTTKITALALDTRTGGVLASCAAANQAETTSPDDKVRGLSEWDARRIVGSACACLRNLVLALGSRSSEISGIGITGQQHGMLLLDETLSPLTPFINWQDRRAHHLVAETGQSYLERALVLAGEDAHRQAGCRLAAGYLGVTLFWMKQTGVLPEEGTACFLMDYFGAVLTGARRPVTDSTCAASSGLLDVASGMWSKDLLARLGLRPGLFPEVRPSGSLLGGLTAELGAATGLVPGLPIFVGMGDNQASFLGSVGKPADAVLVNVGTGGQVAAFTEHFACDALLETRPFPLGGYLLVSAGLCGGASYAVLERFFREAGRNVLGSEPAEPLYPVLNTLAAKAPPGAAGLRCEPFFAGTRARPELRASWTGVSVENFTPAHMTRALLEGMARAFRGGYDQIRRRTGQALTRLVGAGNGLRENPVLARLVADAFDLPLRLPRHREEAAYGAALLAAVGAGYFPDLGAAGEILQFEEL